MGIPYQTGCLAIQWQLLLVPCFPPILPHHISAITPQQTETMQTPRFVLQLPGLQAVMCLRRSVRKTIMFVSPDSSVSVSNFNMLNFWSSVQKDSWDLRTCRWVPAHLYKEQYLPSQETWKWVICEIVILNSFSQGESFPGSIEQAEAFLKGFYLPTGMSKEG